ncbi:MAG: Cell division protein FtsA, partial [Candidatus Woesebacteria bacterium GW2011_GWA1_39_12]
LANRVPSGVVVTGGGAETVDVEDSARRMLSLPVRIGKPKGVGGLIDDVITPSFATCVGLIIYGAKLAPKEGLTSFGKRIKLPGKGLAQKLIDAVKNLLP